jgi:MarR family transcriptional regulator, 2-MHQ and catechol-resistance regulon repressor
MVTDFRGGAARRAPGASARAPVTTFGRLVEVYSRLEGELGEALERECGIPHTWFEAMLRIARTPEGLTMSALANQIALTTGGVTRLLDRMIASGLVERVPCPTDRRVAFAALTAAGRRRLEEALEVHTRNLETVFTGLSGADLAVLADLLERLDRDAPRCNDAVGPPAKRRPPGARCPGTSRSPSGATTGTLTRARRQLDTWPGGRTPG